MKRLKLYVFGLLTLLATLSMSPNVAAQQGVKSTRFIASGADSGIVLINTAIAWHQISWNVTGTASACTVALDTSSNGSTWTAGGAITSQTCTSTGNSSVVNVSANYVRINMTALTISAGGSVTVTWDGWVSNPAGGGGGTVTSIVGTLPIVVTPDPITATGTISCPTCNTGTTIGGSIANTQVAVGSGANTIAGDSHFTWDSTNFSQLDGIGEASLIPLLQGIAGPTPTIEATRLVPVSTAVGTSAGIASVVQSNVANGATDIYGFLAEVAQNAGGGGTNASDTPIAFGLYGQAFGTNTSNTVGLAGLSGQAVLKGAGAHVGSGEISMTGGYFQTIIYAGTGGAQEAEGIFIDRNDTLTGPVTKEYGIHILPQTNAQATNTYGIYLDSDGTNAKDFQYYSAGGQNRFLSGADTVTPLQVYSTDSAQTATLADINASSTATPHGGLFIVRGTPTGSDASLTETIQENASNYAHVTWNKSAPAGNEFNEYVGNDGGYIASNNIGGASILYNANGTLELLGASGVISDDTFKVPSGLLTVGVDSSQAGTLTTSNGSANAHTTWGSAATISNQINGFATVPTTGHIVTCTVSSTTCTLTDGGAPFNPASPGAIGGTTPAAGSFTTLKGTILNTTTNCSSSASPAVCGSAAAGSAAMPTNVTSSSIQVNTSAVTANSQIFAFTDDTLGTKLGVTCNSTLATLVGGLAVTARVPGTSFTISNNVAVAVNPLCISWVIFN